jgi:phosphopentomutase
MHRGDRKEKAGMARAIIAVLDSFGIGNAPDAADFGDEGADTFGHIANECAKGGADRAGVRAGALTLPNMAALGLGHAAQLSTGQDHGIGTPRLADGVLFAVANEVSSGKDTPSGHWEIACHPVMFQWGYFPDTSPCFPKALTDAIIAATGVDGIIGNRHASGTQIITELGAEHMRSGMPICYTSADSVFQVAAHEDRFGLERLYAFCEKVHALVTPMNIGRVIARPFVGDTPDTFRRTGNRRDFAIPPPDRTLLDHLTEAGRQVIAVGKIGDIFAHRGISAVFKGDGNMKMFDAMLEALQQLGDGDLVFANFVDFDQLYGHRRDVIGYAAALEAFDRRLPELLSALRPGDLLVLTADHGCDPTWHGSEHTRERVPVFGVLAGAGPIGDCGIRHSFADIGASVARHLDLPAMANGAPFLPAIPASG